MALLALVGGVLPSLPGFFVQVHLLKPGDVAPALVGLYNYAWFIGFAVAFVLYLAGRKLTPLARPVASLDPTRPALE